MRYLLPALALSFFFLSGVAARAQVPEFLHDPTGAVSTDGVYTPPAVATVNAAFGGAVPLESDPRIAAWIDLQQAGNFTALLQATEADLRSPDPHPYAAHVWAWTQWATGALGAKHQPQPPADLAKALTFASRVFAYDVMGRVDLLATLAQEALSQTTPNYLADIAIIYAARDFGAPEAAHALSRRLAMAYPATFGAAFFIGDEARDGATDAIAWLDQTPQMTGTPAAALIRWLAAHGDLEAADLAAVVTIWLQTGASDTAALRRLGYQYENLHRHDQALELFKQEHAAFPFNDAAHRVARTEATLRQFDQALATAETWIAQSEPAPARPGAVAALQVKMLADAGEYGLAREIGLQGMIRAPNDTRLLLSFAKALRAEGFPQDAIDLLAPALTTDATNHALAEQYVRALTVAKRPMDALEAIETYRANGGLDGPILMDDWRQALSDTSRFDELDTVLQIAREKMPNVHWMIGNFAWSLANADRMPEAYALIRGVVSQNVRSNWQIARLPEYGVAAGQRDEVYDLLAALAARYPYKQELWLQLQKLGGHGPAFWTDVIAKAPLESFPVIRRARAQYEATPADWRSILRQSESEIARMRAAGAENGEIAKVLLDAAQIADDVIYKRQANDLSIIPPALDQLEQARAYGLSDKDYWDLRFFLLGRLGPSIERTQAALQRTQVMPDFADSYNQLFQQDIIEFMPNAQVPFAYFARYVERRPRDAERLNGFASYHNKYGGSSVVALSALERARRWNPDFNVERETEFAFGKLGAQKRYYDAVYNRGYSVANSERYVNWFDAARENARKEQNTIKTLDLDAMKIVMLRPDGIEEERHFHPIFGRVLYYRIGAFEVAINYTDDGHLSGLITGQQRQIALEYTPQSGSLLDGKITRMVINDSEEFRFTYDDAGQIASIYVVGVGRLDTEYDQSGNVVRVTPVNEDGTDGGFELSRRVSTAFGKLLADTQLAREIESGNVQGIELDDPELDSLQDQIWAARDQYPPYSTEILTRELALAAYLIDHVADHPDHSANAQSLLDNVFFDSADWAETAASEPLAVAQAHVTGIEAVRLWRKLMVRTRPDGLPVSQWHDWTRMRAWIDSLQPQDPEVIGAMARLRAEIDTAALQALSQAGWLARTDLTNPGFWRNFDARAVFPAALVNADFRMRDILVRHNGDVVVAANIGMAVLRRGHWEWFGFDPSQRRFSSSMDHAALGGASNLSSLAEDDQHRLWLGTRSGLMMIPDAYDGDVMIWRGATDGMFGGAVNALAVTDDGLAVGGDQGLSIVSLGDLSVAQVANDPVNRLRPTPDGVLVIGRNALWLQQADQQKQIVGAQVTDAMLGPLDETLYVLTGKTLQAAPWQEVLTATPVLRGVEGHEAIAATAPPTGLALVTLTEGERALTVLYDKGGAVLGEGGFESFSKPDALRPVGLIAAHEQNGRLFMVTTDGISAVVRGQAHYRVGSTVYDLLSDPDLGVTFVATGYGIETVDHNDPQAQSRYFAGANARLLRRAPDGALITHDGQTVLRFAPGSVQAEEIFDTTQSLTGDAGQSQISDIVAATDGSIWAVAGPSVFRWQPEAPLQEFSIFQEDTNFQVLSDMLHALHETADGRILLVASDERHRSYKAQPLTGGLFEFNGTGFARTSLDVLGSWFITSHTQVTDDTAILGTASGFARLRAGKLDEFDQIDDPSYMALRGVQSSLYLGTKGAKVGDDLWLFGTAGGIVAYTGGQWFYPDRLNWILPGRDYANYGARAVHAVETDTQGKVYIATDWGLTVYDPGGAGAQSFLISENRGDFAFSALEQDRMTEVNEILLDALPEDSDSGKLAATFRQNRQKLADLEQELSLAQAGGQDLASLERELRRTQQRDIAVLAKLEQEEPFLFNMLQLNPLDLRALGRKLPEGVVIVQYLPADSELYINIVSQSGAELKQVTVSRAELDHAVSIVTADLAGQARGQLRGFNVPMPGPDIGQPAVPTLASASTPQVTNFPAMTTAQEALIWLYDHLLRPVEQSLTEDTTLIVSPTGSLAYLPFAALIRDIANGKPEYAVQRFDMAMAPSLYALDLLIDAAPSTAFSHLVIGDPDGTLPQARAEAEAIANVLADDLVELRIGNDATYDEVLAYAADARFVHLATHGKLDHRSPRDSYLLLADNRRMSIPQIMTLPLQGAELVFLSACESALGRDGLEFRTIAHAFAHAGAPAIVATLWQVEDEATRKLAEAFYEAKVDGATNAAALGAAQRTLIDAGGAHANPGYWAAALLIGKP